MSKQDYRTPREFLDAVERRFGKIAWDLAATDGHEVNGFQCADGTWHSGPHYSPEEDSLSQPWDNRVSLSPGGSVWLNPPYANIRPWVAKLEGECRHLPRWTLCLVPASMGSKWWADHVLNKCVALGVTRMTFVGTTAPYPKDLALLCYGFGVSGHGFWDWRGEQQ